MLIAAKQAGQEGGTAERRILMRAKSNIGPDQGGFAYRLEQIELEQHAGVFASRAVWNEPIEGTARDALADAERSADERRPVEKARTSCSTSGRWSDWIEAGQISGRRERTFLADYQARQRCASRRGAQDRLRR